MDKVVQFLLRNRVGERDRRDYGERKEMRGYIEYDRDDYDMEDGRRGVRGSGRRDRADQRDYYDFADYNDYSDGHFERTKHELKRDLKDWMEDLENADGTIGPKFSREKVREEANNLAEHIRMEKYRYDLNDVYMAANMLYSDYCEVFKACIPKEKEACKYTWAAIAFLQDDDSDVKGKEKLEAYYCCVAKFNRFMRK